MPDGALSQARSPELSLSKSLATRLPLDIQAYELKLLGTREEIGGFGKWMDKVFFGFAGLDGFVSLIPVVGDAVSACSCIWLLTKARSVRLPIKDQAVIVTLVIADFLIGLTPVAGDVLDFFFRAHLYSSRHVEKHIDYQLQCIRDFGERCAQEGLSDDHPDTTRMRDLLFRGGKTEKQVMLTFAIVGGLILAWFAYSSVQENMRNSRIAACQAASGWFCSWTR